MLRSLQDRYSFFFMAGFSLIPLLCVYIPRALAFLPMLLGLVAGLYWIYGRKEKLPFSKPYMFWILSLGALWGVSSLWSFDAGETLEQTFKSIPLIFLGVFLLGVVQTINLEKLRPYLWLFPCLVSIAALITSFELAFDMPLFRIIHAVGPERPINTSVMNRSVVTLCLCTVAAMSFVFLWNGEKEAKQALGAVLFFSILSMLALTQSQTGQLVMAVAVLGYFLFPTRYCISYLVLAGGIVSALISTPWLSQFMFSHFSTSVAFDAWMQDAFAASRMEIWDFVSKYALQRPFYGFGLEATSFVPSFGDHFRFHDNVSVLHPHNFAVQLWMEFGLIGAVFGSAFLSYIVYRIHLFSPAAARVPVSNFLALLIAAAISYGLWQSWWLGEFVFIFCLSILSARYLTPSK